MKKSKNLNTGVLGDTVKNELRTSYNMYAVPRLTVDWNLNRYTTPTATNTPDEDDEAYDIERFPIESIVEPLRPTKGAAKARVNEAVVATGYQSPTAPKFYVSDTADVYKYWTSPTPTNASGNFTLNNVNPKVTYDRVVKANKIVIKMENTWATPKTYTVHIATTLPGALGSAIGGANPTIDGATGTLTLYYNGTAWVSTRPATLVSTNIAAIEFRVTSMGPGIRRDGSTMAYTKRGTGGGWFPTTGANSSFNLIAIEAHLEADLTSRLISVSDNFDMAEKSYLYPIGTITTNTASAELSNEDGVFNPENDTSPYAGLIEPNAEFNLEYIYTIAGVKHSVQQFKMYVSSWSNGDATTSVELEDYSKYLKEIKPNPFMIEKKTSTEITWRVLDSVGFLDYDVQEDDLSDATTIPVFWTDGEKTVWEVLDDLAQATQTAIYFDSGGRVQVRSRQAAFKESETIDWNLLGQKSGNNLSDIISLTADGDYEANKIEVKYKTTKWKVNSQGKPAMSKVWEPEGETVVVRSSQLIRSLAQYGDTHLFIDQKEVLLWPYKSKVQVDGEIIQYDGKQFIYYTFTQGTAADGTPTYSNPVKKSATIKSKDDYDKYNKMTPWSARHRNHYTGGLKITERQVWNTEQRNHPVDINGWSTRMELRGKKDALMRLNPSGFIHNKRQSTVTIDTPKAMNDATDTFWAHRGNPISSSYRAYGTKFRFHKDKASTTQIAGIAYQMVGSRESGYYIEVRTSGSLSAAARNISNEITIYSRKNGKDTMIGKGSPTAIGENIWYELDVYHSGTGAAQKVSVFLNGQLVATGTTNGNTYQDPSGRFGFFARGKTKVDFEYIFAIARSITDPVDDYGFYDLKYGGVRGNQWQNEFVWNMRTRYRKIRKKKWKKESYRHNLYTFDEFGPYVHEVREFDVKFDPAPVRSSYLFNTNEWFSAVPEYTSHPFGANFIITNVSRDHAVIHGEDNLIYAGAGAAVNQVCVVLGQDLEIAEEESVKKENKPAIRARGPIEAELSSDWIQSKAMAETVATWIATHWSDSVDQLTVEVFGNPILEIGDLVDILYPRENMTPATHKYFIVGVQNSFETGIKTTLTLRRRRLATTVS